MKIATLIKRYNGQCYYCRRKVVRGVAAMTGSGLLATRDHAVPSCRGGGPPAINEVLACRRCNDVKADMTAVEFHWFLFHRAIPESYIAYRAALLTRRFEAG